MKPQDIIDRRKAKGLHVQIEREDGGQFDYYPKDESQKQDFIARAQKAGRKILIGAL